MKICNRIWRRAPMMTIVCWGMLALPISLLVSATTQSGDQQVLSAFLQGLDQTSQDSLGWTGNDACGSRWPHIQCQGSFVSAIQVGSLLLSGTVTSTINQLSNLVRLELQDNAFTGSLPSLSGLSRLQVAFAQNNNFSVIPGDFFSGLVSLTSVYLDYNSLNETGWSIPADVQYCTSLTNLSLTNTNVVGALPDFLGSMTNLRVLALAYNSLLGGIPSSFRNSNLIQLQLNNQVAPALTGNIEVVGDMLSLKQLWLQVNQFTGPIPDGLGLAASLVDIRLNDNSLVGQIPASIASLPSLQSFDVKGNNLDGPIPNFRSSVSLNTSLNGFCQDTPGVACALETSALLAFLSGINYSPLSLATSWIGNNPCEGWTGISCDPSGLHVNVINLRNTGLSGSISPSLGNLTQLSSLILSGNNLTGQIPSQLTALTSLKTVDVSNNDLSGPLPTFSSSVTVIDSGNPLLSPAAGTPRTSPPSGTPPLPSPPLESPTTGPGSSPGSSSGSSPGSSIPATPSAGTTPESAGSPSNGTSGSAGPTKRSSRVAVGAIVGAILGGIAVVMVAVVLFCCVHRRKRQRLLSLQGPNTVMVHPRDSASDPEVVKIVVASNQPSHVSDTRSRADSGPSEIQVVEAGNLVISIQVLRNVTKDFSEQNVLGRGGFGVVYKGELEDGTKIAVKRMEAAVVSSKGLNEFQAEIAVLTKVRHRHLVALLGYCADGNERLLVYEYMPQGTLSQHLFDHVKLGYRSLDWNRRLSIALDVARGMEYLHSLAHKSFIHRDLKPSNILLGDDFRAKVSDFGLVKLAPDEKFSVETRLAGTFGYLAPEYAVTGRVTTKADVFSFGVILMELITGRKALDETQAEENMHLVTWFRRMNTSKEAFMKAIDPEIEVTEDSFRSILVVAELAGHCTAREPHQRPDMGHAVNILAPLVEQWKPTDLDEGEGGIDLEMTLPQALKQWQMYEDASMSGLDDTKASLPTRPTGFAESFTSADGR